MLRLGGRVMGRGLMSMCNDKRERAGVGVIGTCVV